MTSLVREVSLTQGKVALVDDEDYDRVCQHNWSTRKVTERLWYARRYFNGKPQTMSNFILNSNRVIDHIDGDGLNNTKQNLRLVTVQQNTWNRRKRIEFVRPHATSVFKGVSRSTDGSRWYSRIVYNYKLYYLGCFISEVDAAKAYDAKAVEFFGEYAKINFPSTDQLEGSGKMDRVKE